MKFNKKKYEKDRAKCYEMSKSGINLGSLSQTEERISSKRIKTVIKTLDGDKDAQKLSDISWICGRKDALGMCTLHIKDRKDKKCEYCEVNV